MSKKPSSALPPLIRTTLEERRGYHQRFFYVSIAAMSLLFIVLIFALWTLIEEQIALKLLLAIVWLVLLGVSAYFIFYHSKKTKVLDNSLNNNDFYVVSGTLKAIQRLGWKRVLYTIDGRDIDGTLAFPGFTAFFNTSVIDVITAPGQRINLYLLPDGLIAGATYPTLDIANTCQPVNPTDWRVIVQRHWGKLRWFGLSSLFFSLLLVGIAWFTEQQIGIGWGSLGFMLVICNGINLLVLGAQFVKDWPELRVLMNKSDPSVQIHVYQGVAAEWYLTGTRYNGKAYGPQEFDGWIRMFGGLHRIQDNLTPTDRGLLNPLWTPMQVEYLIYKGRMIFLRSAASHG